MVYQEFNLVTSRGGERNDDLRFGLGNSSLNEPQIEKLSPRGSRGEKRPVSLPPK
jgi:hypothetical protein